MCVCDAQVNMKEVEPRTTKLALLLIKFMKFGIVQFKLHEYLDESPNCVYIPNIHHLKLICMNSRHIYLSNFLIKLKIGIFAHLIIVDISIPPPLDPKIYDIQRIFLKCTKCVWLPKLDRK